MKYQLVFSPDLETDVKAFVEQWNSAESCRKLAEAQVEKSPQAQFDPFSGGMVAVLSSVAVGLATNALYDMIKMLFKSYRAWLENWLIHRSHIQFIQYALRNTDSDDSNGI